MTDILAPAVLDMLRLVVFRTDDLVAMFRVDSATVTRWAADGQVAGHRTPGGQWRFAGPDLLPFLPAETLLAWAAYLGAPAVSPAPAPASPAKES